MRAQDAAVAALERAGHPVVRIALDDPYDLGEEFFRWEIATAVAGSILGINPFDQPDVEASKIATRKLTAAYEKTARSPRSADLRRRRHHAVHRCERTRRRWSAAVERADRWRLSRRAPRPAPARATTSRCSPTSR